MRKLLLFVCLFSISALALDRQPNSDYKTRRQKLAEQTNGAAVLLFAPTEAEGPDNYHGFRQDNDFYYLSGWPEPAAALLIVPGRAANGGQPAVPYTEILYMPARNMVEERWSGPKLGPENPQAKTITGFDQVKPIDELRNDLIRLLPPVGAAVMTDIPGFNGSSASQPTFRWLQRANAFPNRTQFQDVKPLVAELRLRKDPNEMKLLRHATEASSQAHLAAAKAIKPGVFEYEVSALMQYEWGRRNCVRPAYSPIVGSGFNGTVLHYRENDKKMEAGETVVIDAAGECSMYAADITRTYPVGGKFTPRAREIYDIVLGAMEAAMKAYVPGKSTMGRSGPDSLYAVAYDYINTHGKDKNGQPLGQYFIHGLGHWVGLDVHDAGNYDQPIPKGAVFTIEPGIYIPDEKLGVRIEDMFWINPDGKLVRLSESLPRRAEEIEALMPR